MVESFFERPILNSPYAYPARHWELDEDRQPTNRIVESRRRSELITPVPKPQKRRRAAVQGELGLSTGDGLSTPEQEYNRPRSSTKFAATSQPGEVYRTPTNGR
jgi:type III restriction enzyme